MIREEYYGVMMMRGLSCILRNHNRVVRRQNLDIFTESGDELCKRITMIRMLLHIFACIHVLLQYPLAAIFPSTPKWRS
jgi:hypothetical protein